MNPSKTDPQTAHIQNSLDQAHAQLAQMEKMAALGQLSSSVAHEMRNLLGMIRNAVFNIERATISKDETVMNNLEVISRSIARAREFIDNLLDLSRIPGNTPELMDVCRVVDDLLILFSKELEWRNIELIRDYETIPLHHIDRNNLQECLLNLVINAIQSMDNGGSLTVRIANWKNGITISVQDTGCGIDPENLMRIFHRFYTTKTNGQGTGLGLTISQSLARDMGGSIAVHSTEGKGSEFIIQLPDLRREELRTTPHEPVHAMRRTG